MPKLDAKSIHKELHDGKLWPVYWLYGTEPRKMRELTERIRTSVAPTPQGQSVLDAAECTPGEIFDEAQHLTLGGGIRFIVVKNAHAMKQPEVLDSLLGPARARDKTDVVCVFHSKDLDNRKKFSKLLTEKAAVIECGLVLDSEKLAWVEYFAKIRNLTLPDAFKNALYALDPWSLDIIDQELEKFSISETDAPTSGTIQPSLISPEHFLHSFLSRNVQDALFALEHFVRNPEDTLPLLGLLAWNVRHLAVLIEAPHLVRLSPFIMQKLNSYSKHWTIDELKAMQETLSDIDFGQKQTPRPAIGLWQELILRFAKPQWTETL
jgi:DNA polymerase III delta subunit